MVINWTRDKLQTDYKKTKHNPEIANKAKYSRTKQVWAGLFYKAVEPIHSGRIEHICRSKH